ncbi:MAG: histidine kinase dimerization/phosphoacceptor domain -containing protein [bacterium]|nr:histidine kinase dimerization/phosphoacceptor domain -containing protein [bacterium]
MNIVNKHAKGLGSELTEAIVDTLSEPIIILDENLRVVVGSRAFYDKFEVDYEKVHGKKFSELGSGEWNIPPLITLLSQVIPEKTKIEGYEVMHTFERLGLRVMILNARSIKLNDEQQNIFVSITDITGQRKTERDKENLMLQKDTLLSEMRHRIGNSLQLIASIILLKAGSTKSEESRVHLEDAHERILSIATVQRNLDPTSEGSLVSVSDYLRALCESLAKSMIGGRKPITIKVTGGGGAVTPDEAIGLGLITTELVMNSLKHAFPEGQGQIAVTYEAKAKKWKLSIGDDGVGLSATHMASREGLGTSIVESLANQLNAKIQRESTTRGTVVSIVGKKTSMGATTAVL